jgi:hypothetical protein
MYGLREPGGLGFEGSGFPFFGLSPERFMMSGLHGGEERARERVREGTRARARERERECARERASEREKRHGQKERVERREGERRRI